jgi:hypothetical protein
MMSCNLIKNLSRNAEESAASIFRVFICIFNEYFCNWDYIAPNVNIIREDYIGRDVEGRGRGFIRGIILAFSSRK